MNYHIDEKALEQGKISIMVDGEPLDEYFLNVIIDELNDIFRKELGKPTVEQLRNEIVRMLLEFDREWNDLNKRAKLEMFEVGYRYGENSIGTMVS